MADIRINALATTAASTASDDFIAVDGSANGTRKLNAYSPTFGGNLTVSGTASFASSLTASGNGTFGGNSLAGNRTLIVSNTATADGSWASMAVDTSASGLKLAHLSSGWSSTFLTGGPTTTQAVIYTSSSAPIVFGVNSTYVGKAESTGWTLAGNLTVSGRDLTLGSSESVIYFGTPYANYLYYNGSSLFLRVGSVDRITIPASTGNVLIGTTVDSSALLQVGTNTSTAAGGMKFGTDTSLYRLQAGRLILNGIGAGNDSYLYFYTDGSQNGKIAGSSGHLFVDGAANLYLRTNGGTTALTLDSSQNATFAGQITASGISHKLGSGGTGSANALLTIDGSSASNYGSYIVLQRNSTNKWQFGTYSGINGGTSDDFLLYNPTAANEALKIAASTSNATFAGSIAIGNTVNTVSPTSPNRTITMVIGGTTYYIHAKTTND